MPSSRDAIRDSQVGTVARARGYNRPLIGMLATRIVEGQVASINNLPVAPGAPALQDPATGKFYFLPDYSALDGPDILT